MKTRDMEDGTARPHFSVLLIYYRGAIQYRQVSGQIAGRADFTQRNPVFGIGAFDFERLSVRLGHPSIGSESFITGTYRRIGAPVLAFVAALLSAVRYRLGWNREIAMVVGFILFVAMLTYGGFIAARDFAFLTLVGLLAEAAKPPSVAFFKQSGAARLELARDRL
jgi:hypothetical protein